MSSSCVWVFPGQGSQKVGMLAGLAERFGQIAETFTEASDALGYDLWQVVQADEQKLNQTAYTQPALLTASVALWRVAQDQGLAQANFMAGHSLGEYSALVCAGAMQFADAVKVVATRGELMQAAVAPGQGAMAAILGLEDAVVTDLCEEYAQGGVLSAVNFNAIGQVVVAGDTAAVERIVEPAKAAGARKVVILPVSVPSHCALMLPAAEQLASVLEGVEIQAPSIPVVHNVDVQTHQDPQAIRQALFAQLSQPVRWVGTIQYMAAQGVTELVECGPGKVLTGLNKRIDSEMRCQPVEALLSGE